MSWTRFSRSRRRGRRPRCPVIDVEDEALDVEDDVEELANRVPEVQFIEDEVLEVPEVPKLEYFYRQVLNLADLVFILEVIVLGIART